MPDRKTSYNYIGTAVRILERVVPPRRMRLRALNFLRAKLEKKDPLVLPSLPADDEESRTGPGDPQEPKA